MVTLTLSHSLSRCVVSWLRTGRAPPGPAHLPWGQWGRPAGGDHQGEGRARWAEVGLSDRGLGSDPSFSYRCWEHQPGSRSER